MDAFRYAQEGLLKSFLNECIPVMLHANVCICEILCPMKYYTCNSDGNE